MASLIYLKISLTVGVQGVEIWSWSWDEGTLPQSVSMTDIKIIFSLLISESVICYTVFQDLRRRSLKKDLHLYRSIAHK